MPVALLAQALGIIMCLLGTGMSVWAEDGTAAQKPAQAASPGHGDAPVNETTQLTLGSPQHPVAIPRLSAEKFSLDGDPAKWLKIQAIPAPFSKKFSGMMKLGWREDGLYGYIHVQDLQVKVDDANPWQQDCVELWLDTACARHIDMGTDCFQIALAPNVTLGAGKCIVVAPLATPCPEQTVARWKPTSDGYAIEFFLPAKAFNVTMAVGTKIGFNYSIDEKGKSIEQFYADKDINGSFCNPSTWGMIELEQNSESVPSSMNLLPSIPPAVPQRNSVTQSTVEIPYVEQTCADILKRRIVVGYRRAYLSEIVADLAERTGIHISFPACIDHRCMFTVEDQQMTVRQVLERLAVQDQLELDVQDDHVVIWKNTDDQLLAQLEKKFNDGDVEARCESLYDLGLLGDKRIYSLMLRGLNDDQSAVAIMAISMLDAHFETLHDGVQSSVWVPSLLKLISSASLTAYKARLIHLLSCCRDHNATDLLVGLLKDKDANVRCQAAYALGQSRDARSVDPLIAMMKSYLRADASWADAIVRDSAAYALANTHDPRAVDALLAFSHENEDFYSDKNLQVVAAYALGQSHDPRVIDTLIALLKESEQKIRVAAASALGETRNPRVLPALFGCYRHWDAQLQMTAATASAKIGDTAADSINAAAKSRDNYTRFAASAALTMMLDTRAVPPLVNFLKDPDDAVQFRSALYLAHLHDKNAIPPLMRYIRQSGSTNQMVAASALGTMRDPENMIVLMDLLKDHDATLRMSAVLALSATRD